MTEPIERDGEADERMFAGLMYAYRNHPSGAGAEIGIHYIRETLRLRSERAALEARVAGLEVENERQHSYMGCA